MDTKEIGRRIFTSIRNSFSYFSFENVKEGIKRFTLPSFIISGVLIVIFLIVNLIELPVLKDHFIEPDGYRIVYSIFIAVIITLIWFSVGVWVGPIVGRFLAQNSIGQRVITGSSTVYFEELEEEDLRIAPNFIFARFLNLLIAWTSISATLVSLMAQIRYDGDSEKLAKFLESGDLIEIILKILIVLIIAPLALTLFVPTSWMLLDVHMKAWNKKKRTSWFVGTKVQNKTRSFIAIGAVVTSASAIGIDQLELVVSIFLLIIAWVGMACVLVVLLYTLLFHAGYKEAFTETIKIPSGETSLDLS